MENLNDSEEYWNTSANKAFSFDEQDEASSAPETFGHTRLIADDNASEVSFELPANEIPLNMLISDEDLKKVLDEQSLEDEPIRKRIAPEEELRILRRRVQDLSYAPLVESTVNKMLLGKTCSLHTYKSIHDKTQLLDEVIRSGNGDGILNVVLFLTKTLNKKQLNRIFLQRPDACNHYLNYLVTRMRIAEATDLLTMLGRDQEAAMLQFRIAAQMHSDPLMKKQRLKKVVSDFFSQPGVLPVYSQIVGDSVNLLEWQLLEKSKGESNSDYIVDSAPIETLYYACSKYKWKDGNTNDTRSPYKLVTDFHISPTQFEWAALNERAKSQAYLDLDTLFEKSTWQIIKQKQFHINIPIDIAIQRLYALNAPVAVLNTFLSRVQDANKKLALAKEVKATRSIIDALALLKDKQELEQFRNSLTDGTEERFYADNSIKNLNKKWSTDGLKLMKN